LHDGLFLFPSLFHFHFQPGRSFPTAGGTVFLPVQAGYSTAWAPYKKRMMTQVFIILDGVVHSGTGI